MHKPVLIGAGLGFLVLALVAGGFWMAGNSHPSIAGPELNKTAPSNGPLPQDGGVPVQPSIDRAASPPRSTKESQERRRRLAEVRAEFNALRAQGMQAPPEKMRAIVNELEALSPPGIDPRYYQTLRNMLDTSVRIQMLNNELQALSKSTAPQASARQQELLAEMRTLGERASTEARNLQSYAPTSPPRAKSP